nr:hypothetical protein CFP56_16329 [Quercus suber]
MASHWHSFTEENQKRCAELDDKYKPSPLLKEYLEKSKLKKEKFENFDCNGFIFRKFSGIAKKFRTSTAYVGQNGVSEIVQQRKCQLRIKKVHFGFKAEGWSEIKGALDNGFLA